LKVPRSASAGSLSPLAILALSAMRGRHGLFSKVKPVSLAIVQAEMPPSPKLPNW
jgi:hypothetical protein